MKDPKAWLVQRAFELLNRLDYQQNAYLEVECGTVFTDDFRWQCTWQGQHLVWQRSTWIRYDYSPCWAHWQGERPKLYYPPEEGKQRLWFFREVGEAKTGEILPILQQLQGLQLGNCYANRGQGRDGEQWTLRMGEGTTFAHLELSWWTCVPPDSWSPVFPLVAELIDISTKWESDESGFFCVTEEREEDGKDCSIWLSCEEVGN